MIERKIKELAIALEALSRIQTIENEFGAVQNLLGQAIVQAEKENEQQKKQDTLDDEIPF